MARYTGPNNKQSRRVGFSVLESGVEFAKGKKRSYGPGQHGADRKRKPSNYSVQLTEKQKVRFMYQISEKQFKKLVDESGKMKGVHGENLLFLLESRLDNLVYRIGYGRTRRAARQLVTHGHITVNGKKVDIPSYICKPGDAICVKEGSKNLKVIKESLESLALVVAYVEVDKEKLEGKYIRLPERNELPKDIVESNIVEFYNRKG